MKIQFLNSKGVSPIIGVLFLLLILVLILIFVRSEVVFITSVVFDPSIRNDISKDVEFLGIDSGVMFVGLNKNTPKYNIENIQVDQTQCFGSSGSQDLEFGLNQIDLLNECSLNDVENYSEVLYIINGLQLKADN